MALAGCSTGKSIEIRTACVLPDASLVSQVDVSDRKIETYEDALLELVKVREQRNICANRINGLKEWRSEAERISSNGK